MRKIIVTGGAGFLGSHLIRAFVDRGECEIVALDHIQKKNALRIIDLIDSGKVMYSQIDLADAGSVNELSRVMDGADIVFSFAAHSNVKIFDSQKDYAENTQIIRNVLNAMVVAKVSNIVFSSSSTVYGKVDSKVPETSVLAPISFYGASKMTAESLVSSYVHMNRLNAMILRFANIVGPDASQGVVPDFIKKLSVDSKELEILGNGNQTKQYVHVDDIVDWLSEVSVEKGLRIYNISTDGFTNVVAIADMVCDAMGLEGVKYRYTGGEGGWDGDVPFYGLDITNVKRKGWKFKYDSTDAVMRAVWQMINKH